MTHLQDLQDRRKEGGKKTLHIVLFIPALALFFFFSIFTSRAVTQLLSLPHVSFLAAFLSRPGCGTVLVARPEICRSICDPLERGRSHPWTLWRMGAGVFIAEVIGNTHIHAQTHVCSAGTLLKQIQPFPNYNSYSICGFARLPPAALKLEALAGHTRPSSV